MKERVLLLACFKLLLTAIVKESADTNAQTAVDQEKILALGNAISAAAPLLVAQGGLAQRVLGTYTKTLLGLGVSIVQ